MCWLPTDQPWLQPGGSTCSVRRPSPCSVARLLATRLRRIGDQLEKTRRARETDGGGFGYGARGTAEVNGRVLFKSFLCTALRYAALVAVVARRHL